MNKEYRNMRLWNKKKYSGRKFYSSFSNVFLIIVFLNYKLARHVFEDKYCLRKYILCLSLTMAASASRCRAWAMFLPYEPF